MLSVEIVYDGEELNPDIWFKYEFNTELLLTDFSRRLLRDICKCEVYNKNIIVSDILGSVDSSKISSGCKAILYMKYGDLSCGRLELARLANNLVPYIHEVCRERDIEVFGCNFLDYFQNGKYSDPIRIVNNNKVYTDYVEYGLDFLMFQDEVLR